MKIHIPNRNQNKSRSKDKQKSIALQRVQQNIYSFRIIIKLYRELNEFHNGIYKYIYYHHGQFKNN